MQIDILTFSGPRHQVAITILSFIHQLDKNSSDCNVRIILPFSDECGVVESVKAVSEIYCPMSGKVVEQNEGVVEEPAVINKDCYGKGN